MNVLRILGKVSRFLFLFYYAFENFSLGGGTCYDLVNAYACFCPDRIFRPQCNTSSSNTGSNSVLMSSSQRK
jgi:hypothetical protein